VDGRYFETTPRAVQIWKMMIDKRLATDPPDTVKDRFGSIVLKKSAINAFTATWCDAGSTGRLKLPHILIVDPARKRRLARRADFFSIG